MSSLVAMWHVLYGVQAAWGHEAGVICSQSGYSGLVQDRLL